MRKGKSFYADFEKNSNVSSLKSGIQNLNLSIEKLYRVKKKSSDGKIEKTEINEAIDYLILLNSFALEYTKNETYSGKSFIV